MYFAESITIVIASNDLDNPLVEVKLVGVGSTRAVMQLLAFRDRVRVNSSQLTLPAEHQLMQSARCVTQFVYYTQAKLRII